jgi:hypothetical protein
MAGWLVCPVSKVSWRRSVIPVTLGHAKWC